MTMTILPIELSNENQNVFDKKNNLVKYEKGNKNKKKHLNILIMDYLFLIRARF